MISPTRSEIEALIDLPAAAAKIEAAYRATHAGQLTLPPVGHITFPDQDADCHIKYGHMIGAPKFVIKVATGFPHNTALGLPTGNGLVLVMSAHTGAVEALLHDEMILTDIRTGIGGAIATKALARHNSAHALVIGSGPQARRQIEAHAALMPQVPIHVWGRDPDRVASLIADLDPGCRVAPATDLKTAVHHADIIITATGATSPVVRDAWVRPGTHITAVGADAPGKQELETALVARADVLSVDLASQCLDHGEVSHAAKSGLIHAIDIHALGAILEGTAQGRSDDRQITVADLTGIAAQDVAMADAVLSAWKAQ